LQVEVGFILPGFGKYFWNTVCSVGVDIVSCGTGKQDRWIANPGPYRAYLGYGLPGRKVRDGLFSGSIFGLPHTGQGIGQGAMIRDRLGEVEGDALI